jgi:integrase
MGVDPFRLHDLRVVFASILARRRVAPKTAQRLLGHEKFQTTMDIYAQFTDDDDIGAEELLEGFGM